MGIVKISESLRQTIATIASHRSAKSKAPPAIQESLQLFRRDNPESKLTAFVMMSFENSPQKKKIWKAIEDALKAKNIKALRADKTIYHSELYNNVLTYIYGCTFGIAVFERITSQITNPNVIFEVGYSIAIGKQVCILKDKTLDYLPTDILGHLYEPFDPHDPAHTIPVMLKSWIKDRGFNDFSLQAQELTFEEPIDEELGPNELDFYILRLQAGQHISIEGYAESYGTEIEIYNRRAKKISPPIVNQGVFDREYSNNRYYGGIWNIKSEEAGPYIVCVSSGTGKYHITATEGAHGVTVGTIGVGESRTGTLERFEFHRWLIDLTPVVGQQINIQLHSRSRDTWLELFGLENEDIDRVGTQMDSSNKYSANIPFEVEVPGKYMISVLNSLGPYTLSVSATQKKRKKH
jgi:hypothetical protein